MCIKYFTPRVLPFLITILMIKYVSIYCLSFKIKVKSYRRSKDMTNVCISFAIFFTEHARFWKKSFISDANALRFKSEMLPKQICRSSTVAENPKSDQKLFNQ